METPALKISTVKPGACFIDVDANGKRIVGIGAKAQGSSFGWVVLEGKAKQVGALRYEASAPTVLEIEGAEVDFELDDLTLCPNSVIADKKSLYRPGALLIVEDGCRVVALDATENRRSVSLRDGTRYDNFPNTLMAIATKWRLIYRVGDEVREICSIDV
jgi:hypothetical protein